MSVSRLKRRGARITGAKLGRAKTKLGKVQKSKLGNDAASMAGEGAEVLLVDAVELQEVEREIRATPTPKEERFVADAAIRAGYSVKSAAVIGHENLIKPHIRSGYSVKSAE